MKVRLEWVEETVGVRSKWREEIRSIRLLLLAGRLILVAGNRALTSGTHFNAKNPHRAD